MADYDLMFPKYKYDPANYEEPSGPAFGGAFVPPQQQGFSAVPSQQDLSPAPMANYGEPPAAPFTIDTNVPAARPQSIEDAYQQTFGKPVPKNPVGDTVGVVDAQPSAATAPAAQVQAPQQPGLDIDTAMAFSAAGTGVRQDPRAVARVKQLQGERQGMYEQQAQGIEQSAAQQADMHNQVAAELQNRARWAETWVADEQKRQAQQAEEGKRMQADISKKQQEAADAAANIDGNRLMKGGGGVLMAIGAALGAFGASLSRTQNFGMQIMQDALDRDLEGQKENAKGKKEAVSFAQDIYQGFRAAGRDELESKMATRAVVYEGFASKIDALGQQLTSEEGKAKADQMAREVRMQANQEALGAAQLAARPKGKAKTLGEIAKDALDLQKQSLENAETAQKIQNGPKDAAATAQVGTVQEQLEGLRSTAQLHQDAKAWQADGHDNLPGAGGVQDIPHDIAKGAKKIFGGSGETPIETRLRVGPSSLGNQIFRSTTGQAANTENERRDALALGQGNGTTSGFIELTEKQHAQQVANVQARIDQLPPNSRERRVAQQQLDQEKAKIGANPDAYRERFGSKK